MDIFKEFKIRHQQHFANMVSGADTLFVVDIYKDEFWEMYLNRFPEGTNPIFRERREYDCSCCRHFIKSVGNVVAIKDNHIQTMWGFDTGSTTFQPVVNALDAYLKERAVTDMFISKFDTVGTDKNVEVTANGTITWDHFYLELPKQFVDKSARSVADIQGEFRATRDVFMRSLTEIDKEVVETVLELVNANALYRGAEFKAVLEKFFQYKCAFDALPDDEKENFVWANTKGAGVPVAKMRNTAIGTLLNDLSDGMDLEQAVRRYEGVMAPANYKRPTALVTPKMIEAAQKAVGNLGYMNSLPRRFATEADISVNNVLFADRDVVSNMKGGGDVFAAMMAEAPRTPRRFDRVTEIGIEDFIANVLPTAQSIEAYLENKHAGNMCSLIAPVNADAPTMFKWGNGFSWAYFGNITDSMKERVKAAGGKVDGDLRFSIQWNEDGKDECDLDAHCTEASGYEIYYGSAKKPSFSPTRGQLDVDIIHPNGKIAVENITWANRKTMKPGKYLFRVHQFSGSAKNGFRAEIEFDGKIYSFDYNKAMSYKQYVNVAEVILDKNGNFSINELIPSNMASRDIWNLKTNNFVPVSMMMYSPNYWDGQDGIGNKHYMFMLKDCINPEAPNGFYNEFLKGELTPHRKVFEILGSKMAVAPSNDQLSGLGFSSTQRNELVVRVKGATERIMKIKF